MEKVNQPDMFCKYLQLSGSRHGASVAYRHTYLMGQWQNLPRGRWLPQPEMHQRTAVGEQAETINPLLLLLL